MTRYPHPMAGHPMDEAEARAVLVTLSTALATTYRHQAAELRGTGRGREAHELARKAKAHEAQAAFWAGRPVTEAVTSPAAVIRNPLNTRRFGTNHSRRPSDARSEGDRWQHLERVRAELIAESENPKHT